MKKINVKLLKRVQKHILEEPRRLIMRTYLIKAGNPKHYRVHGNVFDDDSGGTTEFASCETAGCIAGWACILSGKTRVRDYGKWGAEVLGLNEDQAGRLFDPDADAWLDFDWANKSPKVRAKEVARRIEHFIATKGAH